MAQISELDAPLIVVKKPFGTDRSTFQPLPVYRRMSPSPVTP